jgi:hypothetical protein
MLKHRFNQSVSFLLAICYLLAFMMLPSCAGGGFQSGPPIIASAGKSAFFLFPVSSGEGTPYYVGGSLDGTVAVQWKQLDGTTVLLVKPKRGNMEYYIDGKRVGAKEADPVIPADVVVPDTPPKTAAQAEQAVEAPATTVVP